MIAMMLNPKGRHRRKKAKGRRRKHHKMSAKGLRNIRRAARRRTRHARRHRRAASIGAAARKATHSLLCGPVSTYLRLRRRGCSRGIAGGRPVNYGSPAIMMPNPPRNITGALTAGFKMSTAKVAATMAVGAIAGGCLTSQVSGKLPSAAQSTIGQAAVGIAVSGALAALVRAVAPAYSRNVFAGSMAGVAAKVVAPAVDKFCGILPQKVVAAPVPAPAAPVKALTGMGSTWSPDYRAPGKNHSDFEMIKTDEDSLFD